LFEKALKKYFQDRKLEITKSYPENQDDNFEIFGKTYINVSKIRIRK